MKILLPEPPYSHSQGLNDKLFTPVVHNAVAVKRCLPRQEKTRIIVAAASDCVLKREEIFFYNCIAERKCLTRIACVYCTSFKSLTDAIFLEKFLSFQIAIGSGRENYIVFYHMSKHRFS